ncbi:hypothetical protein [Ottowia thiooxydans]|uniref:Uncharacterized protein n=1 Tax=Ottowia thiooxydans TaxID=219182 RepID=A0ABV2Q737_9BURK
MTHTSLQFAATHKQRSFLDDGDEISFRGHFSRKGYVSIGWGHCTNTALAAAA